MASAHDLEIEAAKLIERLIRESKENPPKLATKLCLVCHHMKVRGKDNTLPFRVISRALESVVNQNGLDMNALMEAAPRHLIPQSGEVASGGNTSKENEMITNQVHARGEEASGKSAQPCAGHVTPGMKIPIPTFRGIEENMQKAVVVKRKAGSSGSTAGEERKKKKQEELMPPLSKEEVASPQQQNPEEAPPAKKTPGNVSPQKHEGTAPTLPSVQAISPPIPPTEKHFSSSPSSASRVPPTRQRKRMNKCVQPSSSPQDPPLSRKGKETVGDIVQLTNGDATTFLCDKARDLEAEKLVLDQEKEKLNKEKKEPQTAVANLQQKMVSVELEKSALTNQLQERDRELSAVKKDLNTIRASVKKATTTITKLNRSHLASNLALEKEKEKVSKLEQELEAAKKSLADRNQEILLLKSEKATQEAQIIQDFLRSRAFKTSTLLALSKNSPFSPDLSSYHWDRKSDKLVSEDGIVLDHTTTFPNLTELHVRYPWIGPFPTLESGDKGSEKDKGEMGHVAGEEQICGGIKNQQEEDGEHRQKDD